jgi:mono/diheme cytochrome c family protein
MRVKAVGAAVCLVLAACAGSPVPRVSPELLQAAQRERPETTADDLERGRQLYVTSCGTCHELPAPRDYRPEAWPGWLDTMGPKAKLTYAQRADVLRYVQAVDAPRDAAHADARAP